VPSIAVPCTALSELWRKSQFGLLRRTIVEARASKKAGIPRPGFEETAVQRRDLTIRNRLGLHARAAAKLVSLCSRYSSHVVVFANGRRADGRRMIALLALSAAMGAQIAIEVSGPDESEAVVAVTRLISDGFGER
jgi:phosphotransferase system HPr (HPr) family protein